MSLFESASLVVTPNGTKASKLYAIKPTSGAGDLSVTRATTATRVNSAGLIESVAVNVPRLDYTNGSCPSILVEPQRTNLALYSEQFNNAYWGKYQATVTANSSVAPDGNTTADTVTVTTGTGGSLYVLSPITGTYTISVFLKAGTTNLSQIEVPTVGYVDFNLSAGTFTASGSVTGTMKSFVNGWYKCTATFTGTAVPYFAFLATGTVGKTLQIWGAQLEAGSYATSYIPTTSSSVTRNADVISKTGISSLIGQTEGTLFLDVKAQLNSADEQDFSISDGTTNNRAFIRLASSGVIRAIGVFAGSTEFNIGSTPYTTGTRYKIALAYKNNDVVLYINGTNVASTNTTTISGTLSRLGFDVFTNGAQTIVSPINSASLWKTRLTNTQLAQLTTI